MLSWFDIAYVTLDLILILYTLSKYLVTKRKVFLFLFASFALLMISDFMWEFTGIPWLNDLLPFFSYIRLGVYAAFVFLALRSMQLLSSEPETHVKRP